MLLLLMFGMLAYGLYFLAAHSAAQLAANPARASVAGITDAEREKLAKDAVSTELKGHPIFADTSKIVVPDGHRVDVRTADISKLSLSTFAGCDKQFRRTIIVSDGV